MCKHMVKALGSGIIPCGGADRREGGCLRQCPALLGRKRSPGIAHKNKKGKKAEKPMVCWKA